MFQIFFFLVLQATGQVEESIGQKILRKVGKTRNFEPFSNVHDLFYTLF